jgi:glycopeptide antibiotics resistance protein
MFTRHPILSGLTIAYLALVGWLTLSPQSAVDEQSVLWRLASLLRRFPGTSWIGFTQLEFAANIAMFVPLGLFFVLLLGRRRWWLALLVAVAITLAIEFAQQGIPNRVSDPRDLVSNSIGAALGAIAALVLTASKRGERRAA